MLVHIYSHEVGVPNEEDNSINKHHEGDIDL